MKTRATISNRRRPARSTIAMIILTSASLLCAVAVSACREGSASGGEMPHTPAVMSVPRPLAPDFHRGVNHAHIHSRGHGYGSEVSANELDSLRRLGVNWIAVTPFGFQEGAGSDHLVGFPQDSTRPRRGDPSMTARDIGLETSSAHRLGIRVVLKPHLWSNDFWNGGAWHGSVDQATAAEHRRWWESYRAFALFYARVAETARVDLYCIGTELVRMTTGHSNEWRALIGDIRRVYHGKLSYAAHWEREFDSITFWDALDYIGITAYFPLAVSDSASVDELVAAWKPHRERIARLAERIGRPVLFLEAGYRPATGTYQQPWLYDGGMPDEAIQARAYEALFRAFSDQPWWHGVYFWKTFTDPALAAQYGEDMGFCFRGRAAQSVVVAWFGGDRR